MAQAAAETTQNTPRKTFMHTVEVEISTEESGERTRRLLEALNEIDKLEADKASRVSDFNTELKQKRKEAHKVRDAINLGKERRDLECYEVPEERTNTVHIMRASDGKKVDERAMTLEDRMHQGKSKAEAKEAEAAAASPAETAASEAKPEGGNVRRIKASDVAKERKKRKDKAGQTAVESDGAGGGAA